MHTKIILFHEIFIWQKKKKKKESILIFSHLPGGHKIKTNDETKEDIITKTRLFKYIDIFTSKNKTFSDKKN